MATALFIEGMVSDDEKLDGLARQLQVHSMNNIANGNKREIHVIVSGIAW